MGAIATQLTSLCWRYTTKKLLKSRLLQQVPLQQGFEACTFPTLQISLCLQIRIDLGPPSSSPSTATLIKQLSIPNKPILLQPSTISEELVVPTPQQQCSTLRAKIFEGQLTIPVLRYFRNQHSGASHTKITISNQEKVPTLGDEEVLADNDLRKLRNECIILNSHGERPDAILPKRDENVPSEMASRGRSSCFGSLLLGNCLSSNCPFTHELITPAQELCLMHFFRRRVCPHGAKCRSFTRQYGHQCPYRPCRMVEKH